METEGVPLWHGYILSDPAHWDPFKKMYLPWNATIWAWQAGAHSLSWRVSWLAKQFCVNELSELNGIIIMFLATSTYSSHVRQPTWSAFFILSFCLCLSLMACVCWQRLMYRTEQRRGQESGEGKAKRR